MKNVNFVTKDGQRIEQNVFFKKAALKNFAIFIGV